jgi:alginate O-acetyltransferase complex protein AlgI
MFDFLIYRENEPLLFTQPLFWAFFAFIIICYQFIYTRIAIRNLYLMAISMYFYYLSGGYYFSLLVFSTLVDYIIGREIYKRDDPTPENEKIRKRLVTASVVINLTTLAYFKYTFFFTDTFNTIFDTSFQATNWLAMLSNGLFSSNIDINSIILPVGISFYTFQTISYSVDVYRREIKPVNNIWDFAFFVSFFPQLVAGPIVRAADFVPQIYQPYHLSESEFGRAVFLIINGLIKKIFISDYISINYVDRIFENPASYSGFENLMGVYGYAIQIYCDFSGYTDIAIGLSLLLGFRLSLNFNSPYKAVNITDFWRRWHISLSSWLRDYLYIPMGGNRRGKVMTYVFLLTTMLLGGLWHGAHIRFIIWGALHGSALALHKMWMGFFPKDDRQTLLGRLLGGFLTFHFVCFCWIFFRADSMELIGQMLSQIAFDFRPDLIGEMVFSYKNVFAVILLAYSVHWLAVPFKHNLSETFAGLPDLTKAIIITSIIIVLFQLRTSEVQPFIYFQF